MNFIYIVGAVVKVEQIKQLIYLRLPGAIRIDYLDGGTVELKCSRDEYDIIINNLQSCSLLIV